jgi:putative copper resistance protein D
VLDPLAIAGVLVAAVLYLRGVDALTRRGHHWRTGRTVSYLGGLACVLVALCSALDRYEDVLFSAHAFQHVLLGMVAPPLIVLGRPVTLALQASSRPTQRRILRVMHSAPVRVITYPLVVWLIFSATLFALYFTPLFELSLRHTWVHVLVHVHFLLAGVLFAAVALGVEPMPRTLPYAGRALFAFSTVPVHACIGLALVTGDALLARGFYGHVHRAWGSGALADQHAAGGILWAAGDLFGVVLMLIVVAQWLRHEQVLARRIDRRLGATPAKPDVALAESAE